MEQLLRTLPPSLPKEAARLEGANKPATSWPTKSIIIGCLAIAIAIVLWINLPSDKTHAPPESSNAHQPSSPISQELPAQPHTNQLKPHEKPTALKPSPAPSASNPSPPPGSRVSKAINLLAEEHGGHLIVTSGPNWAGTLDGKEEPNYINHTPAEAVYAFKDERPATIDLFTMLILETTPRNVKEFELLMGNDSPTGSFESLGTFQTQNVKLMKTPYQEFRFPPVKMKYLKLKVRSTYGRTPPTVAEVQLFGRLETQ
ncbi:MAG: hypothetical protein U0236_15425 [Nitrospira sp.]